MDAAERAGPALTIASFNVRNDRAVLDGVDWWWFRRPLVRRTIAALDADLLALQEVRPGQRRHLRRHLPGYALVGAGRDDGRHRGEHSLVAVRRDRLAVTGWTTRWFGPTPQVAGSRDPDAGHPRCATLVEVTDRRTGHRWGMAGVHLDAASAAARSRAAGQLATWCGDAGRRWVLAGDFNAAPDAPELAPLTAAGWRDALGGLAPRGPGVATYHGFTGSRDGERIDHLLVAPGPAVTVLEGQVVQDRHGRRHASDHWPVRAVLVAGPPAGEGEGLAPRR